MSFIKKLIFHPRQLLLRRALFQIHLWAGVLLSLYIVMIALTGSVLVFRSELQRTLLPKALRAYDPVHVASIAMVLEQFEMLYPGGKIENVITPSTQVPAFVLTATDAHQKPLAMVADPITAKLYLQPRTWLDWVYDLHVYLLLSKTYGMQANGFGAAILLLLGITGLALWWPGIKIWTRGLRIGLGNSWRRINFDAHNAIGFWTLLIVSWWAISGIYFAWYRQVSAVVAVVSPLKGMVSPIMTVRSQVGPVRASLSQVLDAIHVASPSGHLYSLSDPSLSGATIYALVDLRAPGDFSHRDILTLSTTDARVLTAWHYGQNRSLGDCFLWAMHPLHFGTLWGLPVKILWALCGIALAALSVTGLVMYWNRFLRHQVRA
jgi:uncharacterized iron-regulated membrane protein